MFRKIALTITLMLVCCMAYGQTQPQITSVEKSFSADTLIVKWNGPGWNADNSYKAEFTGYRLEWRRTGAGWGNASHKIINKHLLSIRLTGLLPNKAYVFRIKAENNDQGWGWSEEKEATTSKKTPQTIVEYQNEDNDILEFQSIGKDPKFQVVGLRGETLKKDSRWGGVDIRQFVKPNGYDLRVKSLNGDEIARVGTKFYLRMMSRAEFDRIGWGEVAGSGGTTIADQFNGNRRQERHPFFWTIRHGGQAKGNTWDWVEGKKPTEAWFRFSVNLDKCKCRIRAGEYIGEDRSPGVDGAMYFLILQVKVKRPTQTNPNRIIDNRIPMAVSLGGNAPQAPMKPHQRSMATTWARMKSER